MKPSILLVLAVLVSAVPAAAQVNGHVSAMVDAFPDLGAEPGAQAVAELRTRLFLEHQRQFGERVRLLVSGYLDAATRRGCCASPSLRRSAAVVRPGDVYLEFKSDAFDVRAGMSRVVWGRLDEFQPTDVVNPIDLTRFLLEGRSEARLSVGMVRARVFLPKNSTLEAIAVPGFRASRFDQLAEESSPFNLTTDEGRLKAATTTAVPAFGAATFQGGARFTTTTARVDWGVSAYRGRRTFPTYTLVPTFAPPPTVLETFPRFTMIGADFETARGPWGVRGEAAWFVDDTLQAAAPVARGVEGQSLDAGVGVDRRAGDYRVAGNVLMSWNSLDGADMSLVASADRSFSRETRTLRVFAVYDPADATFFGRVIGAISLRDNLWLEGSAGLFAGSSADTLGRLTRRDFFYTRIKLFL